MQATQTNTALIPYVPDETVILNSIWKNSLTTMIHPISKYAWNYFTRLSEADWTAPSFLSNQSWNPISDDDSYHAFIATFPSLDGPPVFRLTKVYPSENRWEFLPI